MEDGLGFAVDVASVPFPPIVGTSTSSSEHADLMEQKAARESSLPSSRLRMLMVTPNRWLSCRVLPLLDNDLTASVGKHVEGSAGVRVDMGRPAWRESKRWAISG